MAEKSQHEFCIGAVLFKGGSIINKAYNTSGFIGYRKKFFQFIPTRHAEVSVIHGIHRSVLKKCSILVVRLDSNKNFTSAKPCKACIQMLKDCGIRRVYYSSYSGEILEMDMSNLDLENYSKEKK